LAALLSPWSAPVTLIVLAMAFEQTSLSHYELTLAPLVMVPLAYVGVGLLGLPVYLWLKRRQRLTWWSFTGWGAGAGMILFWLLDAMMLLFGRQLGASWDFHGFLLGTVWGLVVGFTVAATFVLIAGVPLRQPARIMT
jgi:hypothetical protein